MSKNYVKTYFKVCKIKKIKIRLFCLLICLLFILIILLYYFNYVVNPIILNYCESEVTNIITESANLSIYKACTLEEYKGLIEIKYDSSGNISAIESNTMLINKISNTLAVSTQNEMDKKSDLGISIPIGTCSGIGFLAGKGNKIRFTISPIGNVICSFHTLFEDAGINQTSHKIYIDIESEISLILPFNSKRIKKNISFLISECVIVGKVPDTYLGISKL